MVFGLYTSNLGLANFILARRSVRLCLTLLGLDTRHTVEGEATDMTSWEKVDDDKLVAALAT